MPSETSAESQRRCYKCGRTPAEDSLTTLFRFPKPGKTNTLRCELWAKYCFPDKEYWSPEFQHKLHTQHKMLCNRHFPRTSFSDYPETSKKLHRFAVPDEIKETEPQPGPLYRVQVLNEKINCHYAPKPLPSFKKPTLEPLPGTSRVLHASFEENVPSEINPPSQTTSNCSTTPLGSKVRIFDGQRDATCFNVPKRKNEESVEFLSKRLKELERYPNVARPIRRGSKSSSGSTSGSSSSSQSEQKIPDYQNDRDAAVPAHEDVLSDAPLAVAPPSHARATDQIAGPSNLTPPINYPAPLTPCTEETGESNENGTGQSELLDILGADPSVAQEFGDEINQEVASTFEHIATTGLEEQVRQELIQKFLVPSNCTKIAAPMLNAEIEVASGGTVVKRDKAIQYRQKQLAAAITGIGRMLTSQLRNEEKSNLSKQLIEIGCILCDIQHSESSSRMNFAPY
ncbi:unnamed protein product, partial [Iphiclides podalirius]